MQQLPDPRFEDFIELINRNGDVIGFLLEGDEHKYIFDEHGGWFDKQGKYFNADAILSQPPINSESESQHSQDQQKSQMKQEQTDYTSTQKNKLANQKVGAIRNLADNINGYPQQQLIPIELCVQPQLDDIQIQQFFKSKDIEIECSWGKSQVQKQKAIKIIDYEGAKVNESILYIDIPLKNGVRVQCIDFGDIQQLEDYLILKYTKGKHFGNLELDQKGKIMIQIEKECLKTISKQINCKQLE